MTDQGSAPTSAVGAREPLVPGWLQRLAALGWRVLVTIAMGLVLVWLATSLSTVTASTIVALIFAATFAPYIQSLRARGWGRVKAAVAVSAVALGVVVLAGLLVVLALAPHVSDVVAAIRSGIAAINEQVAQLNVTPEISDLIDRSTSSAESTGSSLAGSLIAPIASAVTIAILGGFLTVFLLMDGDRAWAWLVAPIEGWRADAITAHGQIALDRVGGYLRGTAVIASIRGLSSFAFMVLLGVPFAGPLAVIAFIGGFIPYIGGFVATILILLVALAENGATTAFVLLILMAGLGLILGRVVGPVIYGRTIDVHPAMVLIALPAGAALFGVIGLVGALPFVALVIAMTPALILALDIGPDSRYEGSPLVPVWLDRLGQWSWRGLVVAGLLAIGIAAVVVVPIVFIPIILAIVLAATLDSTAGRLRKRGWSRGRAALTVTLGSAAAISGIIVLTLAMMVGPLQQMMSTTSIGARATGLDSTGLPDLVDALQSGFLATVASLLENLATLGLILLLATLITFYLLRDGEAMARSTVARLGPDRGGRLAAVGGRATTVLGGYMIGTGVVSLFGASTMALVMFVLGLPLILPIAVLSFFLGYIPYIGGFIGTALAFLVTVAVGDTSDIVIMAIFTIVFNIAQGNFVAPLVYGRTVSLHPAIVLMAIPAGAEIAGIIGMFLIVPFLGVIAVSWRTVVHMFDPVDPGAVDAGSVTTEPDPVTNDPVVTPPSPQPIN